MSIDRYANFISEQALIAKLDEASKKGRYSPDLYSLNKIKDKHYHLEYDGGAIATITHVPPETPDGKHIVHLDYRGVGSKGIAGRHTQDFPATGTDFEGPALNQAIMVAKKLHAKIA